MKIHGVVEASPQQINLPGAYEHMSVSYDHSAENEYSHPLQDTTRDIQQRYVAYVEHLLTSHLPDAIHAHDWLTFEAGIRAKDLARRPLIAHIHATEFDRAGMHRGNSLVHEIELNGLLAADKIIAVSNITKQIIVKEYGIPANKIDVVHNSLDTEIYPPLSTNNTYCYVQHMKRRGYKVIVSVGRLTVQKGLWHLLEAAKRALDANPKLLFLIAGDGELRDELLLRSAELGIAKNVLFTGFVRGQAWRDAYEIGDMFVMPSVSEPFGLVALEAAGYGNAVLISKQSGVSEVLRNILSFDYWDSVKLADQIVAIAHHEPLRNQLQRSIGIEYKTMSWERAADTFMELYSSLRSLEASQSLGAPTS